MIILEITLEQYLSLEIKNDDNICVTTVHGLQHPKGRPHGPQARQVIHLPTAAGGLK